MLIPPNLFHYATSELSQDAFLAWLLAWADTRCKVFDPELHNLGTRFVSRLLQLHGEQEIPADSLFVKVSRQVCRVDVVAEINDRVILAIEDKTETSLHDGNVEAIAALEGKYPDRKVLPVYLKTGDQPSFCDDRYHRFRPFLRANFLSLLTENRALLARNAIVSDFHAVLEQRESDVNA